MKLDMWMNALAIILFLGFLTAAIIAFSTLDRQKEITIASRYGRQIGLLEIIYVNVSLVMVAVMLHFRNYRFLPALFMFVVLIFFNSRVRSGISPIGIFVGMNFIEWKVMDGYQIVNDEISTIEILVYANHKRYVLRCSKEYRKQIEEYFEENGVTLRHSRKEGDKNETFD